jgi:hypothetical protein
MATASSGSFCWQLSDSLSSEWISCNISGSW